MMRLGIHLVEKSYLCKIRKELRLPDQMRVYTTHPTAILRGILSKKKG